MRCQCQLCNQYQYQYQYHNHNHNYHDDNARYHYKPSHVANISNLEIDKEQMILDRLDQIIRLLSEKK